MELIFFIAAIVTICLVSFCIPNSKRLFKITMMMTSVVQLSRATLGYARGKELLTEDFALNILPCLALSIISITYFRRMRNK